MTIKELKKHIENAEDDKPVSTMYWNVENLKYEFQNANCVIIGDAEISIGYLSEIEENV